MAKQANFPLEMRIGLRIKEIRANHKISQEQLALKAGLDRTYINSVENGRRNISINSLAKIATALDLSLTDFFDCEFFMELS